MHKPGTIVLTFIQFVDTPQIKLRPAVILFEELENIVVAGITSNLKMQGIPLTKEEGAFKDSVIKTNYIFTISKAMIKKELFTLSKRKKQLLFKDLELKLKTLLN